MTFIACTLCGLPVGNSGIREIHGKTTLHFCCFGCRQVFQILSGLPGGLPADFKNTDLYRLSQTFDLIGKNFQNPEEQQTPNHHPDPSTGEVTDPDDPLARELILKVEGLWCNACSWLLEGVLSRCRGVLEVKALFMADLVRLKYLPHEVTPEEIQDRITRLGYRSSSFQDSTESSAERKRVQLRLGISAILTAHIMMISLALYAGFFQELGPEAVAYLSYPLWVLATPVLSYGGFPIFQKALVGLRYGNPSMEILIAIGSLSAYFYSFVQMIHGSLHVYFDTASMLIVLVLLGKYLEARAKEKISGGLTDLYLLAHQKVRLITEEGEKWRTAEEIRPGDEFLVPSGERVPVDGWILSGQADLDESTLTGESRPIKKRPNDEARAGSLVLNGSLEIRATLVGPESSIGQMITLVQEGLSRKTEVELLADRLTRWIVPVLLFLAAGTAIYLVSHGHSGEEGWLRAVTILVISCPCALGIATPLAKVASLGVGRAKGFLIRDPAALEKIRNLDLLIFDKTGTLTEGRYSLMEMVCFGGPEAEAWQKIASLEALSDHLLARKIQEKTRETARSLEEVIDFQALPGLGVKGLVAGSEVIIGNRALMESQGLEIPKECESRFNSPQFIGATIVLFGWQGRIQGFMAFRDGIKKTAPQTLAALYQKGFQIWMVSGDSVETTRAMAGELGLDAFVGQALPQDKVRIVQELQQKGHRVGMIGDGLNDAAALAQADVGFALGIRAGILADASDITLLTEDPLKILEVLDLSNRTLTVIRQNLGFAFFYNILGIPLAMTGLLNPLLAVLAMFASSLTVIGNTLRIYKGIGRHQ